MHFFKMSLISSGCLIVFLCCGNVGSAAAAAVCCLTASQMLEGIAQINSH